MNERLYERIRHTLDASEPYPGYPQIRFTLSEQELAAEGEITIPDGPWQMNDGTPPTADETARFKAAGYEIDTKGRPLHPGFRRMATDPDIGVVVGRGFYYNWGPNYTADPIVVTKTAQPRILLIKRGDTGAWALPGGFVDPADTSAEIAARRELEEEAGLKLTGLPSKEVYRGVVGDRRTTAHAWAETSAYLFQLDRQVPVAGNDDAVDAKWVRLDQLDNSLFGSHTFLVDQARQHLEHDRKKALADTLATPKEQLAIEVIDAGHMAYDHYFVRDIDNHLFVKEHDASRFSDPFREAHSRSYLEKEYMLYEHIAERGFSAIPDRVELIGDSLLAMDALHTEDGWQWRAPQGDDFGRYVHDILAAINELSLLPVPNDPAYHKAIEPTYETLWKEGWDAIDNTQLNPLITRIKELASSWNTDQQRIVDQLIDRLEDLHQRAQQLSRTHEFVIGHNDARQSNIAWHPKHGARIVDWSWGDPAPKGADATMFLIDLAKSGYDITPYLEHFNKDHALTLIGFWLAHSLWQTRDGSTTVREHQVASATAAFQIVANLEKSVTRATYTLDQRTD